MIVVPLALAKGPLQNAAFRKIRDHLKAPALRTGTAVLPVSVKPPICVNPPPNDRRSTPVSEPTVAEATDSIYASLQANNADIDAHIATLKAALKREGMNEAVFDPARLAQNNRSGRKLMQAYFRQRGVSVRFSV